MKFAASIQHAINAAMVAVVLAPILLVVWMSFTPTMLLQVPLSDPSLRWYRDVLADDGFIDAARLSLLLAALAATIAVSFGFLAAYGLVRAPARSRAPIMMLFTAPLVVPAVVFGIAALQFTNQVGLYGSFWALLAAHVVIVTPFAVRPLEAALRGLGPELEWAARSLGAPPAIALLRITVPLALRPLVAAFLFCFLMSFSEITVTIFMTGPAHQTLPVRIFNYVSDRIDPTVAAVSALIVGFTLILVLLLNLLGALTRPTPS
jgi:putative spermidine/putrescine transport system permease protein